MSIESDKPRQLTSDFIPEELVFEYRGIEMKRRVHSARANSQTCDKCGFPDSQVWEFKLHPLTAHPNYLMAHRGKNSCGTRVATIDPADIQGWVLKELKN